MFEIFGVARFEEGAVVVTAALQWFFTFFGQKFSGCCVLVLEESADQTLLT